MWARILVNLPRMGLFFLNCALQDGFHSPTQRWSFPSQQAHFNIVAAAVLVEGDIAQRISVVNIIRSGGGVTEDLPRPGGQRQGRKDSKELKELHLQERSGAEEGWRTKGEVVMYGPVWT